MNHCLTAADPGDSGELGDVEEPPAPAQAPLAKLSFAISAEFGGEKLADVTSSAGTYSLNAGDGSGVSLGFTVLPIRRGKHSAGLALDLGYTRAGVEASNGKLHTRRVPVSLMAQYHRQVKRSTRWQLGLGVAHHRGVRLTESDGLGFEQSIDLDSTIGLRAAVGVQWYTSGRYGVELDFHYERVRHQVPQGDAGVDASNIGASLRFIANLL